jgi:hypothetical protein
LQLIRILTSQTQTGHDHKKVYFSEINLSLN